MDKAEQLARAMDLLRRVDQQHKEGNPYGGHLKEKVEEFLKETERG